MNPYYMTVSELQSVLAKLLPTDELWPNQVRNLAIYRNGGFYGAIDFLEGTKENERIEIFDTTPSSDTASLPVPPGC